MGSVVEGGQRPLDGFAGCPVVPDAGGHGQQPLGDAGEHPAGGAAAVAFQVELAFEGVEAGFNRPPLMPLKLDRSPTRCPEPGRY